MIFFRFYLLAFVGRSFFGFAFFSIIVAFSFCENYFTCKGEAFAFCHIAHTLPKSVVWLLLHRRRRRAVTVFSIKTRFLCAIPCALLNSITLFHFIVFSKRLIVAVILLFCFQRTISVTEKFRF